MPTAAVFKTLSFQVSPEKHGVFCYSAAPGLYCAVYILDSLSKIFLSLNSKLHLTDERHTVSLNVDIVKRTN